MDIKFLIPNFLTLFRLITAPLIPIIYIKYGLEPAIGWFLLLVLTDIFDGRLSRFWKTTSEFGRKTDSIADALAYILIYLCVIHFEYQAFTVYMPYVVGVFTLWILTPIIGKLRSNIPGAIHLNSRRFVGFLMNVLLLTIPVIGVNPIIMVATIIFYTLSLIEEISIYLIAGEDIDLSQNSIIPYLGKFKRNS